MVKLEKRQQAQKDWKPITEMPFGVPLRRKGDVSGLTLYVRTTGVQAVGFGDGVGLTVHQMPRDLFSVCASTIIVLEADE